MHQTEGFTKNSDFEELHRLLDAFMHRYHALRGSRGVPHVRRQVQYSDMSALGQYLECLGLIREEATVERGRFKWMKPHSFGEIMECFERREMTTWGSELKEPDRRFIARELRAWLRERDVDLKEVFHLPAEVVPHVYRKSEEAK